MYSALHPLLLPCKQCLTLLQGVRCEASKLMVPAVPHQNRGGWLGRPRPHSSLWLVHVWTGIEPRRHLGTMKGYEWIKEKEVQPGQSGLGFPAHPTILDQGFLFSSFVHCRVFIGRIVHLQCREKRTRDENKGREMESTIEG